MIYSKCKPNAVALKKRSYVHLHFKQATIENLIGNACLPNKGNADY